MNVNNMKKYLFFKILLLTVTLCTMFLNVGCSIKNGEEKSTEKHVEENTTEGKIGVDNFNASEDICEYLVDKTWYSEVYKFMEREGDYFHYYYYGVTFRSDGIVETEMKYNHTLNDEYDDSYKWTLSEDNTLVIYNSDDEEVYEWRDTQLEDETGWKLSADTLTVLDEEFSLDKPEFPDFNEVYLTEHDELKEMLVNNVWKVRGDGCDCIFEFYSDGTFVRTDYYVNEQKKENYESYWNLSNDNTLQIGIYLTNYFEGEGDEGAKLYKLLELEDCISEYGVNGDHWLIEKEGYFIINAVQIEKIDKSEMETFDEQCQKYNPYNSDEELLEMYYSYVKNTLSDWYASESCYECKDTDLATIMTMDNDFAKVFKTYFEADYVFTSDEFKGATWKDIVYNGGSSYPTLTVSKNGNTLTVPIIDDPVMREAVDAYLAYGCANWFGSEFGYVDEDDIPELISWGNDGSWSIYTYKNGEVIWLEPDKTIGYQGELEYEPKQNKITVDQWEGGLIEVCIQGDKIVPIVNENYDNIQNSSENSDVKKALEEYAKVVATFEAESGDYYEYCGVALAYIDEDDVPEMIIDTIYYGVHGYLYSEMYTYKNGELLTFSGVDYINGYIPKTGKYVGDVWYEVYDEEGSSWLEGKEVICSMDGSVVESVPIEMFEDIEYFGNLVLAIEKMEL